MCHLKMGFWTNTSKTPLYFHKADGEIAIANPGDNFSFETGVLMIEGAEQECWEGNEGGNNE